MNAYVYLQAMEKIREWLLLKISLFKKPLTNYQIPQNALLKNRYVEHAYACFSVSISGSFTSSCWPTTVKSRERYAAGTSKHDSRGLLCGPREHLTFLPSWVQELCSS